MFNARIMNHDGEYRVEVPEREVNLGALNVGQSYRVAILPAIGAGSGRESRPDRSGEPQDTPVKPGDRVEVEIEDVGQQGDGIARIGPGYIVFVPGTEIGDRVTVEVGEVRENFAFAEVVKGPY